MVMTGGWVIIVIPTLEDLSVLIPDDRRQAGEHSLARCTARLSAAAVVLEVGLGSWFPICVQTEAEGLLEEKQHNGNAYNYEVLTDTVLYGLYK